MFARCLSKGANRIGSDLLLGLYSTDEILDITNIPETHILRNDDGSVKDIIDVPSEEVK